MGAVSSTTAKSLAGSKRQSAVKAPGAGWGETTARQLHDGVPRALGCRADASAMLIDIGQGLHREELLWNAASQAVVPPQTLETAPK